MSDHIYNMRRWWHWKRNDIKRGVFHIIARRFGYYCATRVMRGYAGRNRTALMGAYKDELNTQDRVELEINLMTVAEMKDKIEHEALYGTGSWERDKQVLATLPVNHLHRVHPTGDTFHLSQEDIALQRIRFILDDGNLTDADRVILIDGILITYGKR